MAVEGMTELLLELRGIHRSAASGRHRIRPQYRTGEVEAEASVGLLARREERWHQRKGSRGQLLRQDKISFHVQGAGLPLLTEHHFSGGTGLKVVCFVAGLTQFQGLNLYFT